MTEETAPLLSTLAEQVAARDPVGQFETIQRIGVARLFEFDTLLRALRVGGIELAAFIATLASEHSPEPERHQKTLQACQAAQHVAETEGLSEDQLTDALASEFAEIFGRRAAADNDVKANARLLILDDIFPVLASGFRVAEYNAYLERYPHADVYSTATSFHYARETRPFAAVVQDYRAVHHSLADRVHAFNPRALPAASVVYTIFLNNACNFIPLAEARGASLVFTLYPGGGFQLNDPLSDRKLKQVFASPSFRGVIVTQSVTHRYLLKKKFCDPEKIHYVFGGVLPARPKDEQLAPKRRYGVDKTTLDICFAANKYMPGGVDKGFDVFLAVARRLAAEFPAARFHVAGTLAEADGDLSGLRDRITFHGCLPTERLHRFFHGMDLIVSPNLPFRLKPGAFDGFPTGSCAEAALCGAAVFCTDELKLNTAFKAGEEIVVLTTDPGEISETVATYCRDPERLHQLAINGTRAFQQVFSSEDQMRPRFAILDEILGSS